MKTRSKGAEPARFNAVALYPRKFPKTEPVLVVLWLGHDLTALQRLMILGVASRCIGEMKVHNCGSGSAVIAYRVPLIPEPQLAEKVARFLSRLVERVTGSRAILQALKNERAVSRALAAA